MENEEIRLIYETFYRPLYLYALSLTHHPQNAEDLVQETILKAYLSYSGKESIQAWLFKVLKNLFIDDYRKNKRMVHSAKEFPEDLPEDNTLPNKTENRRKWLYCQLYRLPQRERDVMILTMSSGMNDTEIAGILDLTPENLRVIRYRVKNKLKQLAKQEEEHDGKEY